MKRAVALTVALAATGGTSAIAFTGAPGAGGPTSTDTPDLLTATVDPTNAVGTRQAITYCFDEPVQGGAAIIPTQFLAYTYDSARFQRATVANLVPTDGKCVDVEFTPNIDLKTQGTVAALNTGTVKNLANRGNNRASAPITGSTVTQKPGQTTGPDLISATARASDVTVEYVFDQNINPAAVMFNRFGVVSNSGVETLGTSLVSVDVATSTRVTIKFPPATDVTGSIRQFARRDAVRTFPQTGLSNGGQPFQPTTSFTSNPDNAVGTATSSRPVLTAAAQQVNGSSQFVVTYSGDLGAFDPTKVLAILDNGEVEGAVNAQTISGQTKQRLLSFPPSGAVAGEPSAVVNMVSTTGAASTANGNLPAPISAVVVGPGAPSKPGFTNAPDLLTTNIDATTSQAGFTFDEPVNPDTLGPANQFRLLVPNGAPIDGTSQGGVSADKKTVFVNFSGDVTAGNGVALEAASVFDKLNNPNPQGSVSSTNLALPPGGTTTPPAGTPTPVATVGPGPGPGPGPGGGTTVNRKTKVSIKRKSGGRRYTGKVSPSVCASKRTVRLYKGSKKIKTTKSKSSGSYSIKLKKRPRGKVRVKVTAATRKSGTTTYKCSSASSKKVRG